MKTVKYFCSILKDSQHFYWSKACCEENLSKFKSQEWLYQCWSTAAVIDFKWSDCFVQECIFVMKAGSVIL